MVAARAAPEDFGDAAPRAASELVMAGIPC
jgi:hypothetical protein